jgi:hypothetical protein
VRSTAVAQGLADLSERLPRVLEGTVTGSRQITWELSMFFLAHMWERSYFVPQQMSDGGVWVENFRLAHRSRLLTTEQIL